MHRNMNPYFNLIAHRKGWAELQRQGEKTGCIPLLTAAASLIKNSTIMKNWILVAGLVILGSAYSLAQGRPAEAAQRVRAMKVAFITERMNLTPEEAEKFWPLQKAFEAEQRKIRENFQPERDLSSLSEAEIERQLNNIFEMEEQITRLKKEYFAKFKRVLPVRKLALYYRAETEFNKGLIRSLQQFKRE